MALDTVGSSAPLPLPSPDSMQSLGETVDGDAGATPALSDEPPPSSPDAALTSPEATNGDVAPLTSPMGSSPLGKDSRRSDSDSDSSDSSVGSGGAAAVVEAAEVEARGLLAAAEGDLRRATEVLEDAMQSPLPFAMRHAEYGAALRAARFHLAACRLQLVQLLLRTNAVMRGGEARGLIATAAEGVAGMELPPDVQDLFQQCEAASDASRGRRYSMTPQQWVPPLAPPSAAPPGDDVDGKAVFLELATDGVLPVGLVGELLLRLGCSPTPSRALVKSIAGQLADIGGTMVSVASFNRWWGL